MIFIRFITRVIVAVLFIIPALGLSATGVIEKQLADIGSISNDEIIVVQRQFTNKDWRHEFSPIQLGGIPFGTVRKTLVGGASYTLHATNWLGLEILNFAFTKTFFTSFTDDVNTANGTNIRPDYQKLLYFLTSGIQVTPFYGKTSSFSRWIAYLEPYLGIGLGMAKTESNAYLTVYPAVGLRIFFKEWLSMKLEFRNYLYNERVSSQTTAGVVQTLLRNNYALSVSLSFWLPKMPG